jgi:hypothetical protein
MNRFAAFGGVSEVQRTNSLRSAALRQFHERFRCVRWRFGGSTNEFTAFGERKRVQKPG